VLGFFKGLFSNKSKGREKLRSSTLAAELDDGLVFLNDQTKNAYRVASCQSSGRERNHNEDTLFTLNSLLDGMETTLPFGLFLVADGMGGHHSGEKASSLAVHAASQYLIEKVYYDFTYDHKEFSDVDIEQYLKDAVEAAQLLISRQVPGGGTTLTLVMALGDRMFFAHVGDSRCYRIDLEGKMSLITKDHSLVKRLIDLGEITEDEANRHPQRNVLYRALGQNDPFEPDIGQFDLLKGERLLICSDGLWGVLDEEQMLEIINHQNGAIEQIACDLVQAANDSGGPDNISLILVESLV
jgi:protein phosphatase